MGTELLRQIVPTRIDRFAATLWLGVAMVCGMFAPVASAQVSIYPAIPNALETVRVTVPQNSVVADVLAQGFNTVLGDRTRVTMASNHIVVTLVLGNNGFGTVQAPALDLPLGQLPAGDYQVEVRRETEGGGSLPPLGESSFSVAARGIGQPLWNNTDMWWNSSESGWGISIVQHGTRNIFSTFYLYDADGKPVWYVLPGGTWLSSTTFQGTVYRTSGPQFAENFDPSKVTVTPVGSAILDFVAVAYDRATVTISIDGKTVIKTVQRQGF